MCAAGPRRRAADPDAAAAAWRGPAACALAQLPCLRGFPPSTVAWSTVHGYAKLALEGKFGAVDTEPGRREIMATLRPVLDYQWPAAADARA